jgi:hypothetical protein
MIARLLAHFGRPLFGERLLCAMSGRTFSIEAANIVLDFSVPRGNTAEPTDQEIDEQAHCGRSDPNRAVLYANNT